MSRRFVLAPILLFLALGVGTVGIWWQNQTEAAIAREEQTQALADQLAQRLQEFIRVRLSLLELFHRERREGLLGDVETFRQQTAPAQRTFPGFYGVTWMDTQGIIRWVSPLEGNEGAIGIDVTQSELADASLRRARESGRPSLTPPVDRFEPGLAIGAFYPELDASGQVTGFVNGIFVIETLVRACLPQSVFDENAIDIRDGTVPVFSSRAEVFGDASSEGVAQSSLSLLDRRWSFRLLPLQVQSSAAGGSGVWFLIVGLCFAGAIASGVRMGFLHLHDKRRKAEQRMEMQAKLQHSQKMQAIGQLAGGVAHDFNNLLTVIQGNAAVLRAGVQKETPQHESAEQIVLASAQAASLTRRLLSFTSQQIVQARSLSLHDEIAELEAMLKRLVREDVELRFELRATRDGVLMDPGQLSQIVINLVVNAVDAMPEGGRVCVSTRDAGGGRAEVVLSVQDSGHGMSAETRARAIEPFFTTKPIGQGTGLGLSTVYGEVQRCGGRLVIHSEPGKGTTIEALLPLEERREAERTPDRSEVVDDLAGSRRVLLVEDEPEVRDFVTRALEQAGHKVIPAGDGLEAQGLVDQGIEFDVVIADAVMPRLGGLELVESIREVRPDVGAVIMSGYSGDLLAVSPDSIGAGFLSKPFSLDELRDAIDRVG